MSKMLVLTLILAGATAADLGAQRRGAAGNRATVTFAVTVEGADKRSARTEAGRIAFENLKAGAYRLRFEREGFVTLERELTARGGAPTDVKVTLAPMPAPPPPAPVAS